MAKGGIKMEPAGMMGSRAVLETLVQCDMMEEPVVLGPSTVLVKLFAYSEDGRRKHALLPARDMRALSTNLRIKTDADVLPMAVSSSSLHTHKMEVMGLRTDDETGELLILVQSFRHDSYNIPHGTPLAHLHFVSTVVVEVNCD